MKRYTVKSRIKKLKKRATASAVAGAAALGILLGSNFKSPAELLEREDLNSRPAVTDTVIPETPDDEGAEDSVPGDEKKRSITSRFKERVMALPYQLRAFVLLPLWCVGWLIINAAALVWEPFLSPMLSALLNCICIAGIAAAALVTTVKAAFPDMPLSRILNRRSLSTVFIGALFFGAAGAMMQIFLPEYDRLGDMIKSVILLAVLAAAAVPIMKKEAKRRRKAAEIAQITRPQGI